MITFFHTILKFNYINGSCSIFTNLMIKIAIFYFEFGIKRVNCINFQPEMASLPRFTAPVSFEWYSMVRTKPKYDTLEAKVMAFVFNFRRFLAFRISTIRFQWVVENYSLPRDQIASLKQQFNITDRFSRFLVFNSPASVFKDGLLRVKLPTVYKEILSAGPVMTPKTVWRLWWDLSISQKVRSTVGIRQNKWINGYQFLRGNYFFKRKTIHFRNMTETISIIHNSIMEYQVFRISFSSHLWT